MSRDGLVTLGLLIVLSFPFWGGPVRAGEPPLTIVDRSLGEVRVRTLFLSDLEQYRVTHLDTSTPWTDGRTRFEGVRLRDLLPGVLGPNGTIVVRAHNDYFAKLPVRDLTEHDILLAWRADDRPLTLRDKGPFWLVYPLDALGADASRHLHKMVWQVRSIELVDR